jgi:hypothetical protein
MTTENQLQQPAETQTRDQQIATIRRDKDFFNNDSPRQRELVSKLRELTAHDDVPDGRTVSTKDAAATKAEAAAKLTPAQRRQQEISRDPKYLAGDKALVDEMKRVIASQETPEERGATPLNEAREEFNLTTPDLLRTPWARENWNPEDERVFLDTAHAQGWAPDLVQSLVSDYANATQGSMGEISPEMIETFHAKYKGRLTQATRDGLVKWISERAS